MRLHIQFLFLTLVLLMTSPSLFSAPDTNVYPPNLEPQKKAIEQDPYYSTRRFTQSASSLFIRTSHGATSTSFLGFSKSNYQRTYAHEWSLFISASDLFGGSWTYKQVSDQSWEPYWEAGVEGHFTSRKQLSTLVDWQRYNLKAGVGFEDFFKQNRQYRIVVYTTYGYLGLSYLAGLSWTFGD